MELTDKELEQTIYETQETHDSRMRKKLLDERKRRNVDECV